MSYIPATIDQLKIGMKVRVKHRITLQRLPGEEGVVKEIGYNHVLVKINNYNYRHVCINVNNLLILSEDNNSSNTTAINDSVCKSCNNDRVSSTETICWKCGNKL